MRGAIALLALLLAACTAPRADEGVTAAQAMAPLIGCWREAGEGAELCFETLGDHVVEIGDGHETTYHYDDSARLIAWAYAEPEGARANGAIVRVEQGYIIEPYLRIHADGGEQRLRARWALEGADVLRIETEQTEQGRWRAFSHSVFERVNVRQ